jgi:uncharacterized protein YfcZ (UPF0381/DUF406 family)
VTTNNKRKLVRRLHDVRVDEVSAVDKSAGVGTKIMLRKRASTNTAIAEATKCLAMSVKSIAEDSNCDKNAMLTKTFAQYQQHLDELMKRHRKNLDVAVSPAAPDEGFENPDERDDDDDNGSTPHFHAGSPGDDETTEATDGIEQAEQELDDDNDEKEQTMKSQLMSDVVKRYGITAFCKSVEQGDVVVSEHELTKLIDEQANRENTSFVKVFEAQDERGIVLRKAIMAARDAQFLSKTATAASLQPVSLKPRVSGFSGKPAQQNVNDPKTALSQLAELVAAMRAANPDLTEAQAFATVYVDPANADLAARERAENRPTAVW